jgi:FkbM family methyltransferase
MYTQNNEEQIINQYFSGYKGVLLDIGANDGITFSNSLSLIENGWSGFLVEPSEKAYEKLKILHQGRLDQVHICKCGIAEETGIKPFFESGSYEGRGNDVALLSCVNPEEKKRWGDKVQFEETIARFYTFNDFICLISDVFGFDGKLDFISIDAEGMDWQILQQIDLKEYDCKCLCIEHNGNVDLISKFKTYCEKFSMKQIGFNNENIIFSR